MSVAEGTLRKFKLDALAQLKASGGPLNGAKVVLVKNTFPEDGSLLAVGDLDPCEAAGYAGAVAVTWSAPYFNDKGQAVMDAQRITVIATGAGLPEYCRGYAFTSSDGAELLQYRQLLPPEQVNAAGDGYHVDAEFIYQD